MSNAKRTRRPASRGSVRRSGHACRTSHGGPSLIFLVVGGIAVVALAAVAIAARGGVDRSKNGAYRMVATGELNQMGMRVVQTSGSATGTATAGGIQVEGSNWTLGHVPLNVAVRPSWRLTNTSGHPVTLGQAYAEVRRGCCPGPISIGRQTLAPGESTTVTFELSMHPGMDGWHDIGVNVPVRWASGEDVLALGVTGDFRD